MYIQPETSKKGVNLTELAYRVDARIHPGCRRPFSHFVGWLDNHASLAWAEDGGASVQYVKLPRKQTLSGVAETFLFYVPTGEVAKMRRGYAICAYDVACAISMRTLGREDRAIFVAGVPGSDAEPGAQSVCRTDFSIDKAAFLDLSGLPLDLPDWRTSLIVDTINERYNPYGTLAVSGLTQHHKDVIEPAIMDESHLREVCLKHKLPAFETVLLKKHMYEGFIPAGLEAGRALEGTRPPSLKRGSRNA